MGVDGSGPIEHVQKLVAAALDAAGDASVPTSLVAQRALRVARLRGDWAGVLWLSLELRTAGDEAAKQAVAEEVRPHLTTDELHSLWDATTEQFLVERALGGERILAEPLNETEVVIATLRAHARLDADFAALLIDAMEREKVLTRVRQRIADYLSRTERQLMLGRFNADSWERNRTFVDHRLSVLAPQALEQFEAAHRRQREGDPEALSHALTSCRRVLKTVADAVYPATGAIVTGIDRIDRRMTDDRFIARLCQFVAERASRSGSRDLIVTQVGELGRRLDSLNSIASKGVHANVSAVEVDQCLIQTYLTVGDILRIEAGTSAALSETQLISPQ